MQINTAKNGYTDYFFKTPNVQGVTKNDSNISALKSEEPQNEAQKSNAASCKSYRLWMGRGMPERIYSETVCRLAKIHDKLGLDWQPPDFINGHTEFEPYMELDMLFKNLTFETPIIQVVTNGFVNGRLVLDCTFAQMDATAYRLAAIMTDARSRLNTEGLAEKLETLNLPESIDRELLLNTLLQEASEGLEKAENFIESQIQRNSEIFAKRKFRFLVDYDTSDTDSEEFRAKFEPFQKTTEELMRKNIELAENVINEKGISKFVKFFSINKVPAKGFTALEVENFLKELPQLDNTVTFDLFGNNFTRDGLAQIINQIKRLHGTVSPFKL